MAADEPQAGGDRALPREAAAKPGSAASSATRSISSTSLRRTTRSTRSRSLAMRSDGRRGERDRSRRGRSSTSARISAPGSRRALERTSAALAQILERCEGDTWLLMENSAGAGGTIGRSLEELAHAARPRSTVIRGSASASTRATSTPRATTSPIRERRRRARRARSTSDRPRPAARAAHQRQRRASSARTATATRTSSRARWARAWAPSSPTRVPAPDAPTSRCRAQNKQGAERGRDPEAARPARALGLTRLTPVSTTVRRHALRRVDADCDDPAAGGV